MIKDKSISPLGICIILLAVTLGAHTSAKADPAMFRVGQHYYTIADFTGKTEGELRKEFDAEVGPLTDDKVKDYLGTYPSDFSAGAHSGPAAPFDRKMAEQALWERAYHRLLDSALCYCVVTEIGDEMCRRFDLDLQDYFSWPPLRDAFDRERRLNDFLNTHKDDPASEDERLWKEAKASFRVKISKDYLSLIRRSIHTRLRFTRFNVDVLRSFESGPDAGKALRLCATYFVLKDACAHGIFRDEAAAYFQFQTSVVQTIDIAGYSGKDALLREFFGHVVDTDGDMSRGGLPALSHWLNAGQDGPTVTTSNHIGSELLKGYQTPPVGYLSQTGLGKYRMIVWIRKSELTGGTADQQKAVGGFLDAYAFKIAIEAFLPKVETMVPGWKPDVFEIADTASVNSVDLVAPDVEVDGGFIKQTVPNAIFEEFENEKVALADLRISAATAEVSGNIGSAKRLSADAMSHSASAKTKPVREAYRKIADDLSRRMHLPPTSRPSTQSAFKVPTTKP